VTLAEVPCDARRCHGGRRRIHLGRWQCRPAKPTKPIRAPPDRRFSSVAKIRRRGRGLCDNPPL